MSTTASEVEVEFELDLTKAAMVDLRRYAARVHDDLLNSIVYGVSYSREYLDWEGRPKVIEDYRMKRLGEKHYGFFYRSSYKCSVAYRCSHLEAQRRFRVWWVKEQITRRLTA